MPSAMKKMRSKVSHPRSLIFHFARFFTKNQATPKKRKAPPFGRGFIHLPWRLISQVLFLNDNPSKPSNLEASGKHPFSASIGGCSGEDCPFSLVFQYILSIEADIVSVAPTGGYPLRLTADTLLSAAWTFLSPKASSRPTSRACILYHKMAKIEANSYYGTGVRNGVGVTRGVNFGVSIGVGVTTRVGLGVTVSGGVTGCLAFEGRGSLGYITIMSVRGMKTKTITSHIKDNLWPKDRFLYTK